MGLIFATISTEGLGALLTYGRLIVVLVGSMAFVALVMNQLSYSSAQGQIHSRLYSNVFQGVLLLHSLQSSAANIPVNMELCEDMGLDEDTYSISIPLGATINMAGAFITISTMAWLPHVQWVSP